MININDNACIAELARQQSIEIRSKVYAVDDDGKDAVYINGLMMRWAYIDDIEIVYSDENAENFDCLLHGVRH